jgi:hypothetical protein
MKWAWNPEDIGGRRMLLVQVERLEQDSWRCLTDAIQALSEHPTVERVKRTPNHYVHTIKFGCQPTLELLEDIQCYVETIYQSKCEGDDIESCELDWQLSEPVEDRLRPKKPERPQTLKSILETRAGRELQKIRDEAMKQAVERLDRGIEAGEITEAEAYRMLKLVLTGGV